MNIGILRCDQVRSTLRAEFGGYPQMIKQSFLEIDDSLSFTIYFADQGQLPKSTDECDSYIITGSRFSVFDSDELWINQLKDFVVRLYKAKIKTIGICFGHQLIAKAMDGRVERADNGWQIGIHKAIICENKDFMKPHAQTVNIAMMCEDQIHKLPETAIVLAKSQECNYMMLQYDDHFLSIQGHPEFSKNFAKSLLNIRKDDLPKRRLEKGLSSFDKHKMDSKLLFNWFINFMR